MAKSKPQIPSAPIFIAVCSCVFYFVVTARMSVKQKSGQLAVCLGTSAEMGLDSAAQPQLVSHRRLLCMISPRAF
jgi:hypothetical protein